ncbi:MAG: bifunctional YncE family protein/alkaline phosphatase family protein [Bacteroidota bacterium]
MMKYLPMLVLLALSACNSHRNMSVQQLSQRRIQLPNQWSLTPAGNTHLSLGDLPLQLIVSPDQKWIAVTNNGVGKQKIQLFRNDGGSISQSDEIPIAKAWYGLAFSADGNRIYASGGNDNTIVVFRNESGKLRRDTALSLGAPWPKNKICPAGVAVNDAKGLIYTVTKEDSAFYALSLKGDVVRRVPLESEPYAVLFLHARNEVAVSLWGARKILVFDSNNLSLKSSINTGDHPNEMITDKKERILYVACSLDNAVHAIDLETRKTLEVLNTALYPDAPNGSTPNSLALSENGETLYIANADNNCLAVYEVKEPGNSEAEGFIPTGWYPTSVRCIGNSILVANGKGMSSVANPKGPSPFHKREDSRAAQYIGALYQGTLSVIEELEDRQLEAYSKLVYENCPYNKARELQAEGEPGNPVPMRVGDSSPIRYVFYIIKENRTYDQVLGDLPASLGGNGDPNLCLFPEKVTPNQHWLAREYVLLDNFYVDAEVSADGHNWSTAAYANDFVEKTWPTSYGGRGGNYDYEGTRKVAFPKGGFIWDNCKRAGVSYRTYGEFADDNKANYETIEGHFCPNYSSWDMDYQDISREKDWQRDFDSLLQINQVPRFNTIRFGKDHTSGMAKGAYSPYASVADNDLAVGRFLEHLSNSKIWKESAVFILEDDAQNGADHVDAHRSIAFVISPYVKRRYVDHTMYSTTSMLRTMELILGLPPMSQYDAAATPMWRCFTDKPDFTPIRAIEPGVSIDERNAWVEPLSRISETWNLAEVDAVPDREFNEVLWKAIKGLDSEMPAPRRAAWLRADRDDD